MTVAIPSFADLYDAAKAEMQSRDPRLTDFNAGSALDALAGGSAILADEALRIALHLAKAAFVDTATGDDLDTRITDLGGPARNPATAASVELFIVRGSYVGAYTIDPDTEITGTAPDGSTVTFTTSTGATIGAPESEEPFTATCTVTGRSGNVPEDTLVTISGLPSGLTIEQRERAAGGSAEESDDAYRARYRLWVQSLRRATLAALEYGARTVAGVSLVTLAELDGYVAVYIGDPDAGGNSGLVDDVETALDDYRAAGVEVRVYASEREELDFTIAVTSRPGSDLGENEVRAAAIAFLDAYPTATDLYLSQFEAAIHDIDSPGLGPEERVVLSVTVTADDDPDARTISPSAAYKAIRTAADGSGLTIEITEAT